MQKFFLGLTVVATLFGCVHAGRENAVRVADGFVFDLLPPGSFGKGIILTQAAVIEVGNAQHELLFYTEITPETISLVGALPNGTRLFSIIYDGQTIQADGDQALLGRISPQYFLADLQLAQWPLDVVQKALANRNPCFGAAVCSFAESADQLQRILTRDGETIIEIHYTTIPHYEGSAVYEHRERGYRLQVETLEIQELALPPTGTLTPGVQQE